MNLRRQIQIQPNLTVNGELLFQLCHTVLKRLLGNSDGFFQQQSAGDFQSCEEKDRENEKNGQKSQKVAPEGTLSAFQNKVPEMGIRNIFGIRGSPEPFHDLPPCIWTADFVETRSCSYCLNFFRVRLFQKCACSGRFFVLEQEKRIMPKSIRKHQKADFLAALFGRFRYGLHGTKPEANRESCFLMNNVPLIIAKAPNTL
ncbi:MAG: hypothetical protein SOX31_10290 [Eubacteriales bacterium]|nr:hypothetical protein [Eubacteriales bacterium]